jgi:hypothetical protein
MATRARLLERKAILENQIRNIETRIVKEHDPIREKRLFNLLNKIGKSLERVNKLLGK